MSRPAIVVEGLGKRYSKSGRYAPLWAIPGLRGSDKVPADSFWALRDLSFTLDPGEALGVVGRNGAGKSTLLKLLSRITPPTTGRARLRGRVASLLEVGTGFQKSLSGRENIYLNAAILGMPRAAVNKRLEQIVDFAGVGEFLDMPVKNYSSGMYSRLAFAVAAHVDADILLVDEVLSVGDIAFRQKSLGRMTELMGSGRTVVFVSHSMDSILQFCRKALWLDRGQTVQFGPAAGIVREYIAAGSTLRAAWKAPEPGPGRAAAESGPGARILSFEVLDRAGAAREVFPRSEPITVRLRYRIENARLPIVPAFHLIASPRHMQTGDVHVFTGYDGGTNRARPAGEYVSTSVIPANLLHSGEYRFACSLVSPGGKLVRHEHIEDALACRVVDDDLEDRVFGTPIRGVIRPALEWETRAEGAVGAPA